MDEPEPEAGSSQLDEGEVACGGLVVAGGDGAELLQLVVQPLDPIPQAVQLAVERQRRRAGRVGRDHRQDAADQQVLPDPVGIVAHVADQAARARRHVLDQGLECAALVRLPGREDDGERQPIRVAAQVQLGREATAGAAQRLSVLPPLAPAACWWARTTVASSICSRSSAAPLPARAANTASNRPRSRQRAKRRQTVFHRPYRSGIARQPAPSRARHRMPSSCRRVSWLGRPRSVASNGPTSSHSASVRSPRATPFSRYSKGGRTDEHDYGAFRPHGLALRHPAEFPAVSMRLPPGGQHDSKASGVGGADHGPDRERPLGTGRPPCRRSGSRWFRRLPTSTTRASFGICCAWPRWSAPPSASCTPTRATTAPTTATFACGTVFSPASVKWARRMARGSAPCAAWSSTAAHGCWQTSAGLAPGPARPRHPRPPQCGFHLHHRQPHPNIVKTVPER